MNIGNIYTNTKLDLNSLACLFLCVLTLSLVPHLTMTGDEVRYVFAFVSLWFAGDLSLDGQSYQAWLELFNLPSMPAGSGIHSIAHSALYAPFTAILGPNAARYVNAFIGLSSILAFSGILRNMSWPSGYIFIATGCLLVLPCLAYFRLLYPGMLLFTLFSWKIFFITKPEMNDSNMLASCLLSVAMVFIHIRAAPLVVIDALFFAYVLQSQGYRFVNRNFFMVGAMLAASFALWVFYQHQLAGSILGTASASFKPSFLGYFDRLGVQLLGFRHGLLTYAPIFVIGFAGLVLAVASRQMLGIYCASSAMLYSLVMVWGTASESYTARFWLPVLPALVIGVLYYVRLCENLVGKICLAIAFLFSADMAVRFISQPHQFLENRFASLVYDNVYEETGKIFNFGLLTAVDLFDTGSIYVRDAFQQNIMALALVVAGVVVLISAARSGRVNTLVSMVLLVALAVYTLTSAGMRPVPRNKLWYSAITNDDGSGVRIVSKNSMVLKGFRIGPVRDILGWAFAAENRPKAFIAYLYDSEGRKIDVQQLSGLQITQFRPVGPVASVEIFAVPKTAIWPMKGVELFQ